MAKGNFQPIECLIVHMNSLSFCMNGHGLRSIKAVQADANCDRAANALRPFLVPGKSGIWRWNQAQLRQFKMQVHQGYPLMSFQIGYWERLRVRKLHELGARY